MKTALLKIATFALAILALSSCATQRQTLAEKCAQAFPSRDTTIYVSVERTDTLYIPGYDQIDTIRVQCPPNATDTITKTVIRTITTPGRVIPVKMVFTDTITAPIDSAIRAANVELQNQLNKLNEQNKIATAKLTEARRSVSAWLPWLLVGILVSLILWLTFRKKKR